MKNVFILILTIALILFVLVPAAYIFLGKVNNPLAITPMDGIVPTYDTNGRTITASASTKTSTANETSGILGLWKRMSNQGGSALGNTASVANAIDCGTRQSYESASRDAKLTRDEEKSIIKSDAYKYTFTLPAPIYDWDYTKGSLVDESASFVYKDTIVNVLARTTKIECNTIASKLYKNFHEKNGAVEYFSSRTYTEQGKSLSLTKAILRTFGKGDVNGTEYFWYLLDEEYNNDSAKAVVTMWYSTRIGRTEYWFAFRTTKDNEENLNPIAEEVLENVEFLN